MKHNRNKTIFKISVTSVLISLLVVITVFCVLIWAKRSTDPCSSVTISDPPREDDDILCVYDSKGEKEVTNEFQSVDFTEVSFVKSNCFELIDSDIRVNCEGNFELTYRVQFESFNQGGIFSTVSGRMSKDSKVIEGSQSSCFLQKQGNANLSCGCGSTSVITASKGTIIKVEFSRRTGTTLSKTKSNESSFIIKKI